MYVTFHSLIKRHMKRIKKNILTLKTNKRRSHLVTILPMTPFQS